MTAADILNVALTNVLGRVPCDEAGVPLYDVDRDAVRVLTHALEHIEEA